MSSIITTPNFYSYTNIAKRHRDIDGNIVAVEVEEKQTVYRNNITLSQIPHLHLGVEVKIDGEFTKLLEINTNEQIKNPNQFKIDYTTGIVWLHSSLDGKDIIVKYWGTGLDLIHSSRVYTRIGDNGEVVETLHDLISNGTVALKFLENLPVAIVEGRNICETIDNAETLNSELIESSRVGGILKDNLIEATENANEVYFGLSNTVRLGSSLNLDFESNINNATIINRNLSQNIENSNGLIEQTADVEAILQQLKDANDEARDVIIPNIDRFDNAKYFILKSDWVEDKVKVIHNMNTTNLIVAMYSPEGESLTVPYKILDDNSIEFVNDTNLDMTVIVNAAYRGKLGDINGGSSNITQVQIMNINDIPNLKSQLNILSEDFLKIKNDLDKDLDKIKKDLSDEGLLEKIVAIGGHNSNIDADKLDGKHSSEFVQLKYLDGYNGLVLGNDDHNLIRTSNLGLIPYREGSNSNIGTSTWRFKEGHIDNLYCQSGGLRVGENRVFIQPTKPIGATAGDIWIKNG